MVKSPPASATGSIPELGRFPGGGHDKPLQCSSLENHMDRGAWQSVVHRVTKSQTQLKRTCMLIKHRVVVPRLGSAPADSELP